MATTIDKYLQIIPNLTFPSGYVDRVLAKIGIESGELIENISQEKLDLSEAEMWFGASAMVSGGGYSKRINNRQITENQIVITAKDRERWLQNANSLREKWGQPLYESGAIIMDASDFWGIER